MIVVACVASKHDMYISFFLYVYLYVVIYCTLHTVCTKYYIFFMIWGEISLVDVITTNTGMHISI
jgi:hypothetical protein